MPFFSFYTKRILLVACLLVPVSVIATIRYVKPGSAGTAPYTSWATASNDLQAVINTCSAGDDIWVAAGTYIPNRRADATGTVTLNNRDNAFVLKNGVRIYGGFAGTETAANQRDFGVNITILSGDIGTASDYSDNCYHVVVCAGAVSGTVLNGFYIRYGNANGSGTITVNTVAMGRGSGAGMRINSSSPTITNCTFSANITGNNGGGMVCDDASPAVTNCLFSGNTANDAGGLYNINASSPEITNCTFSANNATVTAGAIRNGNGSSPLISNCIIWGNLAAGASSAIYNADAGSVPLVNYSLVQGGYSGTANLNINPLFRTPVAATLAPTLLGDFRLQQCSPAVNAGLNSYIPVSVTNDLHNNPRINYGIVDMGAYELQLQLAVPSAAGIVYVDYTKAGNGSSWVNALPELADALAAAKYDNSITQIWVAKGTYYPRYAGNTLGCDFANRNNSFNLNNIKLYGGFANGESDTVLRNISANETILSGDIGLAGSNSDNCYSVVRCAGVNYLNGFTIKEGRGPTGAGLYNLSGALTAADCKFLDNVADADGGGVASTGSGLEIIHCEFLNNQATNQGGGVFCDGNRLMIKYATFKSNRSANGAGIHVTDPGGNSVVENCIFLGNQSTSLGGALCSHHKLDIRNSLFAGNNSVDGGAIHFGTQPCTVSGCTIASNRATSQGGALYSSAAVVINNSIIYGNTGSSILFGTSPTITYSTVQGGYTGTGNISTDPVFVNPVSAVLAPTVSGDYHLQKCSPAINTGNNTLIPSGITKDLDSNNRISFATVDMGAYEKHLAKPAANGIVYVDSANIAGAGDGSSWAQAVTELADALKEAKTNTDVKEIWVAKGTYKPIYNAFDDYINSICHATDRNAAFVLVKDVKLYGGFAGGEINIAQRNVSTNKTIVSGDIDNSPLDLSNNSYHVLISAGDAGIALVDGLTIGGGNADGNVIIDVNAQNVSSNQGAGLYNVYSSPGYYNCIISGNKSSNRGCGIANSNSSPLISNCLISNNVNISGGAGIDNTSNSSPIITNCIFSNNITTGNFNGGGGMENNAGCNPVISRCNFLNNSTGGQGGAIFNISASPAISDCLFSGNSANNGGGIASSNSLGVIKQCEFKGNTSVQYGGGVYSGSGSQPSIVNSVFSGNTANSGGGIYISTTSATAASLINCTFSANSASVNGGAICINNLAVTNKPEIKNCVIWANSAASGKSVYPLTNYSLVTDCIVEGGHADGTNIFDIDPLFVSPQPASAAPTNLGDYHLQPCSPALNLGNNIHLPAGVTKDLDSLDRIKYTTVDMGAYEMQTIDLANTTWKGINSNWNDKINWCGGYIPADTTNVTVPVTSNNPVINAGYDNEVKNISLANNTSIGIANTSKLTINGTYTNNGSTIANNGTWVMAGNTTGQTFPGTLATVTAMNNLEINNGNGVKLDKSFELTGTLIPTAGNITIDNATITLNSDATATARVAAIPAGVSFFYTGTGKFEVERYIPPHRAWRFLTAPLSNATNLTISQAWQEGVSNASRFSPVNPAPGFGTSITRSNVYNAIDGYDEGSTNNASIRYYTGINWSGVPSKTNGTTPGANNGLINDQQGYMLFVRGDRSIQVAGTGVAATVTTLRPKGRLKIGPQTIVCNGWTVIGNPYASPINFHKIAESNPGLPDAFYVWDANLNGSSNVGGWVSYGSFVEASQTYTVAPVLPGSTFANNKGDIASGSAFMVNYTGTLIINENHKSVWGDNVLYRPANQLHVSLYGASPGADDFLIDGLVIQTAPAAGVSAEKNTNFAENLAVVSGNSRYAVLNRERFQLDDTVLIYTGQLKLRSYVLEINAADMSLAGNINAYLEDTYLHRYEPVTMEGSTRYAFSVIADSGSFSPARFRLLFKKAPSFASVGAWAVNGDIAVEWLMNNTWGVVKWEIERSENGIDFILMDTVDTNGYPQPLLANHWLDANPAAGTYYYRIKAVCAAAQPVYSDIVKATMLNKRQEMYVYPNPASSGRIQLRLNGQVPGRYSAVLAAGGGQKILSTCFQHTGTAESKIFVLPPGTASGIYRLEIVSPDGKKKILPVALVR